MPTSWDCDWETGRPFTEGMDLGTTKPLQKKERQGFWKEAEYSFFKDMEALRVQYLRNALLQAARGFDCAGSNEAHYMEGYVQDLDSGMPVSQVWAQMQARYGENNADFLEQFKPYIKKV